MWGKTFALHYPNGDKTVNDTSSTNKKTRQATNLQVKNQTVPGLMAVGGVTGLYLQVAAAGSKSWILRAVVGGKRRDIGLGGYPTVSLADARIRALAARKQISDGIDPVQVKRAAKVALTSEQSRMLTFAEAAEKFIHAKGDEWRNAKHRQQWSNTLTTYAFPFIGRLPVRDLDQADILRVLEPIWTTKTETATRVRGRIESVLDWATTRGHREGLNPARWRGHLDNLLPKPSRVAKVEHHAAIPVAEVGAFVQALRKQRGIGAVALEFAILTAARSGEVRGAKYSEIDFETAIWTIPGERMKARRPHRVPLSTPALALLANLQCPDDMDAFVFPSTKGQALSDMTLSAVMRRMEVAAVPHGFRSTFRDWVAERTSYPHDVAEMALAHTIANKVEAAYRRGDLFEKRRKMMDEWATFLDQPTNNAAVIPMRDVAMA